MCGTYSCTIHKHAGIAAQVLAVGETTNELDGSGKTRSGKAKKDRLGATAFLDSKLRNSDNVERIKEIEQRDQSKEDGALRKLDINARKKLLQSRGFSKIDRQASKETKLMKNELNEDKVAIKDDAAERKLDQRDSFRRQRDISKRREDRAAKVVADETRGLSAADIIAQVLGHKPQEMMRLGNEAAVKAGLCNTGLCTLQELQKWAHKSNGTLIGPLARWSLALASDDKFNGNVIGSVASALNITLAYTQKLVAKQATAGGFCPKQPCTRANLVKWAKREWQQHELRLKARKNVKTDPILRAFAQALMAKPGQSLADQAKLVASAVASGLDKPSSLLRTEATQAAKAAGLCQKIQDCSTVQIHEWAKLHGKKEKGALGTYAIALGASL